MSAGWEINGAQTDRWGLTRYSVVVHAPPALDGKVTAFRRSGSPGRVFAPHMTLYQHATEEDAALAQERAGETDFGHGFSAAHLDLVGRIGTPTGGKREIVAAFPFAGAVASG